MQPAKRSATYEDLLHLSEDVRAEVVGGEIIVSPAPLPRHSLAQGSLGRLIGGPFDADHGRGGPGGWWILAEVDVRLAPHDIVRPDMAGWRRERLPDPWDLRPIDVVADWVCEITSPSNVAMDRVKKRQLYAKHGVAWYWIVDPAARTLEALALKSSVWIEVGSWGDDDVARIAPFDAIELEVSRLFPPRPPAEPSAM